MKMGNRKNQLRQILFRIRILVNTIAGSIAGVGSITFGYYTRLVRPDWWLKVVGSICRKLLLPKQKYI